MCDPPAEIRLAAHRVIGVLGIGPDLFVEAETLIENRGPHRHVRPVDLVGADRAFGQVAMGEHHREPELAFSEPSRGATSNSGSIDPPNSL